MKNNNDVKNELNDNNNIENKNDIVNRNDIVDKNDVVDKNKKDRAIQKELIRKGILIFLSFLLIFAVGVGIFFMRIASRVKKEDIKGIEKPTISNNAINKYGLVTSSNSLGITENYLNTVIPYKKKKGITNTLLIGTKKIDNVNKVDIAMIVSVDPIDRKIRLITLHNKTVIYVPGKGEHTIRDSFIEDDPQLTLFTVNSNFNLNIKNYIVFDMDYLFSIIDRLGGTDIGIDEREGAEYGLKHGHYDFKGEMLRSFSNLHYPDEDFTGTLRKKMILASFMGTLREQKSTDLTKLLEEILPQIKTTYSAVELMDLSLKSSIDRYEVVHEYFPKENQGRFTESSNSFISNIPLVKEKVVDFIYGEDTEFEYPIDYMDRFREILPNDSGFQRN